jgi:hypothetical protein
LSDTEGVGLMDSGLAHRAPRNDSGASGRLTSDPSRSSLGLLPSGPDPVGEWLVHRQPPGFYIGRTKRESKRDPLVKAGPFTATPSPEPESSVSALFSWLALAPQTINKN